MSDSVTNITGSTIVEWQGKEYLLDNVGYRDWDAIKTKFLLEKRKRIIEAAKDTGDNEILREALKLAGDITGFNGDEFTDMLNSEEGISTLLWVMFERRYRGKFHRDTILEMMRSGAISEEKTMEVIESIKYGIGRGGSQDAGNPRQAAE